MSVYTAVTPDELEAWLARYTVGALVELSPIASGIENTNYFVTTERGRFVLTLYERLPADELPFYLNLMAHLARVGVEVPAPIPDRTGALFSYMQKGIVPDILTSAKGLGGGFPVGAMLTTADIASAFSVGVHGTTYGGNPLACAVAGAVFDVINTTEVLDGVKARHSLFMEGLRAINGRRRVFRDLRGEGVWIGCELDEPWRGKAAAVMTAAGEAGLLVLMAGPDVVRLSIGLEEPEVLIRDLEQALARI